MTLADVLVEAAADLTDADRSDGPAGAEWRRGGRVFAVVSAASVDFRLDGPIAAAAFRTPDTSDSARGPEWVTFAPTDLDGHAIDRASAWFAAAWRRAGG